MKGQVSIGNGNYRFPETCQVYEICRFPEKRPNRLMRVCVVCVCHLWMIFNDEEVWDWKT